VSSSATAPLVLEVDLRRPDSIALNGMLPVHENPNADILASTKDNGRK